MAPELRQRLKAIKLLVLDVDGVLTNGSLYYGPEGESHKRFHVRDGLGIRMLQHFGIKVAVISARKSSLVQRRMSDLKIEHWHTGKEDKMAALNEILAANSCTLAETAFVGDDLLDVPVMRCVGVAFAVRDAHPCAHVVAHHATEALGGEGAVREVADAILDAHWGLAQAYEDFLGALTGKPAT
jgi:3-deoxy-D-manno-octulosonate 8-phosphate phosphatase (KDO 8-P phosphatase)